jgi:NHL repeat
VHSTVKLWDRCSAVAALTAIVGLLLFSSSALALKGYVPAGSFAGPGEGAGQLQAPEGLAINVTTGNLYVADTGNARIDEFDSTHSFLRAWGWGVADGGAELQSCTLSCQKGLTGAGAGQFSKPSYVAVDNSTELSDLAKGDVYVADSTNNTVQRFSESGALQTTFQGTCETPGEAQPCSGSKLIGFGEIEGVGVDGAGDLWVYDSNSNLDEFSSAGEFVKTFVSEHGARPGALTFDSLGDLYIIGGEEVRVLKFNSATGSELESSEPNSTFSKEVTAIAVSPATDRLLVNDGNRIDLYGPFGEPSSKPEQIFTSEGFAESHGLAVDAQGAAFASLREANRVQIFNYVPLAPTVEEEAAGSVGPTEAVVGAQVDPFGEAATYHVEYGPTLAYGSSTPESAIGAPSEAVAVQTTLAGLQPNTEYHFRVVAKNGSGTTVGAGQTFSTTTSSPGAAAALPDGRGYELVSDPAAGEMYVPFGAFLNEFARTLELAPSTQPFRASVNGESVAYVGEAGTTGGNGLTGNGLGNEFLSKRNGPAGRWDSADITPTVAEPGESEKNASYESFSEDLSTGFLDTITTPRFSKSASPQGPGKECGALFSNTASGNHGLFSEQPGMGPLACGRVQGEDGHYTAQSLLFAGANRGTSTVAANSRLLVQTPAPMTPGDHEAATGTAGKGEEGNNLYVSTNGRLQPVGILPGGEHDADSVFGSTSGEPLASPEQTTPGDFSSAISADGSRIFWTALEAAEEGGEPVSEHLHALYVREEATSPSARTLQLDASQAPAGSGAKEAEERAQRSGGGRFWTATPDGTKVFFTDCSRLTADSTAQKGSEGCSHTAGNENVSTGNDLYEYDFAKAAGSRLADLTRDTNAGDTLGADVQGVIGSSEDGEYVYFVANGALAGANGEGAKPTSGQPNLYVLHGGVTTFIAQLENSDNLISGHRQEALGDWRPDLGFRTAAVSPDGHHLVFQTRRRLTSFVNQGVREVFTYSAEGPGELTCASCVAGATSAGREGSLLIASLNPTFMARWMSSDGSRVFFNSDEPLVPQDSNGAQDVYEWERAGQGSCISPEGGCIYLLSGGNGASRSYFVDADADGANVFFTHRGGLGQLASESEHNLVFDARVNGGFPPAPPGECASCSGPAPSPTFTPSPSTIFSGPGNVTPAPPPGANRKTAAEIRAEHLAKAFTACHKKHNRAKRLACERQARKRFGSPQKAKKKAGKAKKTKARRGRR